MFVNLYEQEWQADDDSSDEVEEDQSASGRDSPKYDKDQYVSLPSSSQGSRTYGKSNPQKAVSLPSSSQGSRKSEKSDKEQVLSQHSSSQGTGKCDKVYSRYKQTVRTNRRQ
jgi:hypothetical protein